MPMIISFLLQTASAVALLVWGAYMVKTGILRTFGESLRSWLGTRLRNRFAGFAAGIGLAMLLQSSTASALLIASLQASGLVTTAVALSAVLGADLGSALVARILTFDLSGLIPILLIVGTFLFIRRMESRAGQFGRLLLGLAFVLLALHGIMESTTPMRQSPELIGLFAKMPEYPVLAAAAGVCCAVLFFSSLAVVAVAAAACSTGLLDPAPALWLVLGANFGSAILAAITTAGATTVAKKAPLGNFFFRASGFVLGAAALYLFPELTALFGRSPDSVIYFHVAYNAAAGVLGLLFITPAAALVDRTLPAEVKVDDFEVKLLSRESLLSSNTALTLVRRETAKTAILFEHYWEEMTPMITGNPPAGELLGLKEKRKLLARRCRTVARALAEIVRADLTRSEAAEWQALSAANDALRLSADVAGGITAALNKKKIRRGLFFSLEGLSELLDAHGAVARHAGLFAELLSDPANAESYKDRILYEEAHDSRDAVELFTKHMNRVESGSALSVETSALHVDLLVLFRRIDGVIAAGVRSF